MSDSFRLLELAVLGLELELQRKEEEIDAMRDRLYACPDAPWVTNPDEWTWVIKTPARGGHQRLMPRLIKELAAAR